MYKPTQQELASDHGDTARDREPFRLPWPAIPLPSEFLLSTFVVLSVVRCQALGYFFLSRLTCHAIDMLRNTLLTAGLVLFHAGATNAQDYNDFSWIKVSDLTQSWVLD